MEIKTTDPLKLLAGLTAEQVAGRIDALERELSALRVLLRSLRVRERKTGNTADDK